MYNIAVMNNITAITTQSNDANYQYLLHITTAITSLPIIV